MRVVDRMVSRVFVYIHFFRAAVKSVFWCDVRLFLTIMFMLQNVDLCVCINWLLLRVCQP